MGRVVDAICKMLRIARTRWIVFIFLGWNDERKKAAADGGNLDFLDEEIRAGRRGPAHPYGIITIDTSASYRVEPGDRVIVDTYAGEISDDAVVAYLSELGVRARKA